MQIRKIKDFSIRGVAVDQESILRLRRELESRIIDDMRTRGYVPIIDLLPQLYWEYNKDKNNFDYSVIIYGTYVGKKQSMKIMGIYDQRRIMFEDEVKSSEE